MNVNLIVLEVHSESCSLQCSINADLLHKCSANSLRAPVYIYVSSDIKNSNCINVNYTRRGGCPNKIEVHNTDCQRLCEIYRHFILLLLHNCPKCNAVFFSSNKTAPIGGTQTSWLLIRQVTLPPVDRDPHLQAFVEKCLIHEMTQMISESI